MKKIVSVILVLILFSCLNRNEEKSIGIIEKSKNVIGDKEYYAIFTMLADSFNIWVNNKLLNYQAEYLYKYKLDSLLCFNSTKNRFISCRHLYVNIKESSSDDLQYVYGEKIENKWYFFKGPSIVIPRSMVKGHDIKKPLEYFQLHEIALNEVYSGYLNEKGEINEDWFVANFEGSGWGDFNNQAAIDWILQGKRFTNKKDFFEFAHLSVVKSNWNNLNKDSIKQLPPRTYLP
jgi:hypothetical protein